MKHLKPFHQINEYQDMYEYLKEIIIELDDDFNFKAYIAPWEKWKHEINIQKNTEVKVNRSLRESATIWVVFPLDKNHISENFKDQNRLDTIDRIKKVIENIQNFLTSNGYRFFLESIGYSDVPRRGTEHMKNFWTQKAWGVTSLDKLTYAKDIRVRIKLNES